MSGTRRARPGPRRRRTRPARAGARRRSRRILCRAAQLRPPVIARPVEDDPQMRRPQRPQPRRLVRMERTRPPRPMGGTGPRTSSPTVMRSGAGRARPLTRAGGVPVRATSSRSPASSEAPSASSRGAVARAAASSSCTTRRSRRAGPRSPRRRRRRRALPSSRPPAPTPSPDRPSRTAPRSRGPGRRPRIATCAPVASNGRPATDAGCSTISPSRWATDSAATRAVNRASIRPGPVALERDVGVDLEPLAAPPRRRSRSRTRRRRRRVRRSADLRHGASASRRPGRSTGCRAGPRRHRT